jgi:hypothetical protein
MSAIGRVVVMVSLVAQACKPDTHDLALAARASDSLTVAFANSTAQRALAAEPQVPPVPDDAVQACDDPVTSAAFLELQSGALSLALPADFKPIDTARVTSHARRHHVSCRLIPGGAETRPLERRGVRQAPDDSTAAPGEAEAPPASLARNVLHTRLASQRRRTGQDSVIRLRSVMMTPPHRFSSSKTVTSGDPRTST